MNIKKFAKDSKTFVMAHRVPFAIAATAVVTAVIVRHISEPSDEEVNANSDNYGKAMMMDMMSEFINSKDQTQEFLDYYAS